ncbi:Carboxy-S-adenosyl-L-methionine synthase [Patescibacteria group bacterium]|nr:Carboxy-S-adenosyl-L-methionine synthase [Patescibacteria group bacterium]
MLAILSTVTSKTMTEQDKIFLQTGKTEDFAFDERVVKVFDDMVSRSVPFYSEVQRIQADLVMEFLPKQGGVVCDLGCSTGTTIAHLAQHEECPSDVTFIGFDNSEPMLEKARAKLGEVVPNATIDLRYGDLSCLEAIPACDVIILNWTLQFVRPIDREALLKNCYNALRSGGVLLLSEKILGSDSGFNRLYIDHYLRFKKSQGGYSDTENQRKREALENVLIPYRLDEDYELLKRAGFERMDTYFQWFNFVCILAVKD